MALYARFLFVVLSLSAFALAGCSNKSDDSSAASSSTTTPSAPVAAPTVSAASPFGISIYSTYSGTTYNNSLVFAESGTTSCQATATNPVITCTVNVPEGRLYYSDLNFAFAWMPSQCKLLTFRPYGYVASTSATYVPPGSTSPVDCTAFPTPQSCFGGPAKFWVPGYMPGINEAVVYVPDETNLNTANSKTLLLPSASSLLVNSNRQSVNDLDPSKVGNTYSASDLGGAGDGYVANSYRNYQFTCRDDWYDPLTYIINLNVRDVDSAPGNPTLDTIYTWKELP